MRTIIGVMGGAIADETVCSIASLVGRRIAENDWVLLTGGRNSGVMTCASRGAAEAGGLVMGVLPTDSADMASPYLDIAVVTGMGDARNVINVLTSHVVLALPGGAGTISEVALALKNERPVVTVGFPLAQQFPTYRDRGLLIDVENVDDAIALIPGLLERRGL
jgi:uncharacterized protein (TIGR00725 family)